MTDLQFAIIVTLGGCIYFGTPVPPKKDDELGYDFFSSLFVVLVILYVWIDWVVGIIA